MKKVDIWDLVEAHGPPIAIPNHDSHEIHSKLIPFMVLGSEGRLRKDARGLKIWKSIFSQDIINRSLDEYSAFYGEQYQIFNILKKNLATLLYLIWILISILGTGHCLLRPI